MSFKCGLCNKPSKPGDKAVHVVLERRSITYPPRPRAHRITRSLYKDDPGGEGSAVVREVLAHPKCAEERNVTRT